ncbi:serine/arginine repetitive matrix protein 1-like [Coregonus clupeaformis]|uniref:serine/arginine repetitive matrix protein 1-like n=1 Tax=Coregonus clupeaformis TaxID=59861 RepID=UPI001E1C32D1|nr:serine/arginine repetitive matrix protein 1-like [Coregonus clupeaformis]
MVLDPGEDCMDRTDVQGVRGSSSTTDLTGPEPRPDPRKTTTSDSTRLENTRPDAPKTTTNTTRKEETRPDTTKTINTTTTRTEGTRADPPKTTEEPTPDPPKTTTSTGLRARKSSVTKRERLSNSHNGPQPQPQLLGANVGLTPSPRASVCSSTDSSHPDSPYDGPVVSLRRDVTMATASSRNKVATRPPLRRPLSLDVTPLRLRGSEPVLDRRVLQPPWRSGGGPSAASSPPARSLTSPSLGPRGWMRRSESTCTVNNSSMGLRATRGVCGQPPPFPTLPGGLEGPPRCPCLPRRGAPVSLWPSDPLT